MFIVFSVVVVFSPGFDFIILSTSQEIGFEEHPQNNLFYIKLDLTHSTQVTQ